MRASGTQVSRSGQWRSSICYGERRHQKGTHHVEVVHEVEQLLAADGHEHAIRALSTRLSMISCTFCELVCSTNILVAYTRTFSVLSYLHMCIEYVLVQSYIRVCLTRMYWVVHSRIGCTRMYEYNKFLNVWILQLANTQNVIKLILFIYVLM